MKHKFYSVALTIFTITAIAYSATADQTSTYRPGHQRTNLTKKEDLGLGFKWGTLTGLSAKYWGEEDRAWDATIAFENGNTAIGLDYLWHFRGAINDNTDLRMSDNFVPYAGVGLISAFGANTNFFGRNTDNFAFAAHLPLGLEFLPTKAPIGVFVELAFGFGVVPTTYSFLTGDLGARYYF